MTTAATTSVPSITLSITAADGERFHAACEAVAQCQQSSSNSDDAHRTNDTTHDDIESAPADNSSDDALETLERAVRACSHPLVKSLLQRLKQTSLSSLEQRLALLLLSEDSKATKLRLFFDHLGAESEGQLEREQAVSVFRVILTAISCCLPQTTQESTDEPEPKRAKHEGDDKKKANEDDSFDSALLDENDENKPPPSTLSSLHKEIEAIASFATDSLLEFAGSQGSDEQDMSNNDNNNIMISFTTFVDWYNTAEASEMASWIELLQKTKWIKQAPPMNKSSVDQPIPRKQQQPTTSNQGIATSNSDDSPGSLEQEEPTSPTLISFDFSGSGTPDSLVIGITEDNIRALRHLVYRTGLIHCPAADLCKRLLQIASRSVAADQVTTKLTLKRDAFYLAIGKLIVPAQTMRHLSSGEREAFYATLMDVFSCLAGARPELESDEADIQELATAICFFCGGSKSTKLSTGFELLDDQRRGYLTQAQLVRYLRSYLLVLTTLSYVAPVSSSSRQHKSCVRKPIPVARAKSIRESVESGARWTLSHFFEYLGTPAPVGDQDRFSFESFASWYCSGGFNVAPWLELLDLNKVLSLLDDQHGGSPIPVVPPSSHGNHGGRGGVVTTARRPTVRRDRMSSLRRHHSARRNGVAPQPEILFTFPMAGGRSLVVLKDDAVYVREVVETLGLLTANPSATWMDLSTRVAKRRKPQKDEVAIYVNQTTFVQAMQETVPTYCRKRHLGESGCPHSVPEILSNFFQCFDIDRCDNVALDELMGGLSLLCGGKKSLKLAFAFGIFDTRPGMNKKMPGEGTTVHSLSGEDLFLFLRSVLIVLFSCCRQSLDMSDDVVGRCICDTANVICNDVMRHQWETKHLDRLNFDEFGQWYNDGGFERAPWLELLDLKKWVLVDDFETLPKQAPGHPIGSSRPPPVSHVAMARQSPSSAARSPKRSPGLSLDDGIPPPPPEDELDDSFFDESNIMAMDSMDDMDMFLSSDADNIKMASSFSFSPKHGKQQTPVPPQQQPASPGPPLSFHLTTSDKNGGYNMAFSHQRIDHLRRVLNESGLPSVDVREACDAILAKSVDSRSNDPEPRINKRNFDAAMKGILKWQPKTSAESKRTMNGVLDAVFACFDRDGQGKPCVAELACGITVLCQGKKSDKLEHAFEVLDVKKRQKLFKKEMNKYLQAFLSVLLSIAICPGLDLNPSHDLLTTSRGEPVERTAASVGRIVKSGADWATTLIFRDVENQKKTNSQITFDDFASWYTSKGHSSIPWLELIDLRKWVI